MDRNALTQNCILQFDMIRVRSGIIEPLPKLFYELRYSPDQPRDEHGRFTFGSGGGSAGKGIDKNKDVEYNDSDKSLYPEIVGSAPKLNYFNDPALNEAVTNAADEILATVKSHPKGTEAAKVVKINDLSCETKIIIGKDGEGSVKIPRCTEPSVTIHNHPSGNTFSERDIDRFVIDEKAKAMCVIGNNGNWYILEKTEAFNWIDFQRSTLSISSNDDFTDNVLKGADKYGFRYYEKTN